MTAGQILLKYFHTPLGRVRQSLRNGGPLAERITEGERVKMEAAAATLPNLPEYPGTSPLTLHLMSGRRFWYQSLFCLHSFARAARTTIYPVIYDDGTLDQRCTDRLKKLGPRVVIHSIPELQSKLDKHLPADRFPALRDRWTHYPNIRKLIDVHLDSTGWKLVIDSDLLFFRSPTQLLDWLAAPNALLHAVDCQESYGYSRQTMEELTGAPLPKRVNVGLCGLRSDTVNWVELEHWCSTLIQRERTNYYLEQALVAMLASRTACVVAPAEEYITLPSRAEVRAPTAIMHHYVAESKRWYFREGWKHFAAPS